MRPGGERDTSCGRFFRRFRCIRFGEMPKLSMNGKLAQTT